MGARAVVGEAGVPFFYASLAALVEVYALRIRQFFEQARGCVPCIVFQQRLKEKIDTLQNRERLQQFRSNTADRKLSHILEEVEATVAAAEAEVQRMMEATDSLSTAGGPAGETVPEGHFETVVQANLAERAAQASIVVARKYLLQKTTKMKKLAGLGSCRQG